MLVNQGPIFEKAMEKLLYVSADDKLRYELGMCEKAELDYWSAMKTNYDKGKLEAALNIIRELNISLAKRHGDIKFVCY